MKRKSLVLTTLILGMLISFSSCNSYKDFEDNYVDNIPTKTENGLTLHAFCWTFNQIRENLPAIKEAGFQSILTMPVQTPKSGGAAWWAFYQPLGFQVAETSSLGTKEDLRALCEEAESLGISIYSDIVFNHLANIGDDELEKDGTPKVSPKVAEYEPYIYEHRNDAGESATFHHNKNATGSGAETQVYSFGALPDLNTANPYVQERALALLKECIDLGIDGFRFDAAKHIETPDDPDYASDFWPNVLVPAKEYYETKNTGDDLYCYGEILGSPSGRDISVYTKYMDVTADGYAQNLTSGVITNKQASILVNGSYGKSTEASNILTWVESHDTYADSSSHYNETRVAKMWGVIASRKDAQGLYLARPNDSLEVGTVSSYQFENEYVAVSNRFHNRFIGAEEDLHAEAEDKVFVNERYSETDEGAYVLNLMAEKKEYTQTVKFNHLKNGNYYDTVTGNRVVVTNGKATIDFDVSGICILTRSKTLPRPGYTISKRGGSFVDVLDIKITAKNASNSYYFFNNDENSPVSFTDETTVKVGNHVIDKQESITLVLQNGNHEVRRSFTYKLVDLIDGYFNVINLNPAYLIDYELYIWSWSPSLWHKNYSIQDGILLIDTTGYTGFLLAIFEKGYKITNTGVWDSNNVKQSSDIKGETLKQGFYDASGF